MKYFILRMLHSGVYLRVLQQCFQYSSGMYVKSIQDFSLVSCFTSPKYNIVVSQKVLRLMCLTVTIVTRSTCSVSRPSDQLSRVDLGDLWPLLRSYETEFWVDSSWNIFWLLSDEEDGSFLSSSSPGLTLVITWSSPGHHLVLPWSSPGPHLVQLNCFTAAKVSYFLELCRHNPHIFLNLFFVLYK